MTEYSVDVRIYGTLYIEAASEEEAKRKATQRNGDSLHFHGDYDLGDGVTLSSAMTLHGLDEGDEPTPTESEDDSEEELAGINSVADRI